MKYAYEIKAEIYNKWEYEHDSIHQLSREYGMAYEDIRYMVHLADR